MTKVGRREETSIESRASAFCEPFSGICQRVERTELEQPFFYYILYRGYYWLEKLTRRKVEIEGLN